MTKNNIDTVRSALDWISISADMSVTPMCDEAAWRDDIQEKTEQALTALDALYEKAELVSWLESQKMSGFHTLGSEEYRQELAVHAAINATLEKLKGKDDE